jgi:hypothetical protein
MLGASQAVDLRQQRLTCADSKSQPPKGSRSGLISQARMCRLDGGLDQQLRRRGRPGKSRQARPPTQPVATPTGRFQSTKKKTAAQRFPRLYGALSVGYLVGLVGGILPVSTTCSG